MKVELEFKTREELDLANVPLKEQVLMISHTGGYSIGSVKMNKDTGSKYVSNSYYAKYYAIIPKEG